VVSGRQTGSLGCVRWSVVSAVLAICALLGLMAAKASAARHFEQVSPASKGNGDIIGDGATTLAARLGDAVAFSSRTPFGDTVGSGPVGHTQYVARRTDAGWTTHAITPTGRPDAVHIGITGTVLQLYSDDLRTAIIKAYDLPGATDDAPLRFNLYAEDTATRQLEIRWACSSSICSRTSSSGASRRTPGTSPSFPCPTDFRGQ
jgi:hypothetical protein